MCVFQELHGEKGNLFQALCAVCLVAACIIATQVNVQLWYNVCLQLH